MKRHKGFLAPLVRNPQTIEIESLLPAGFGCGDLAKPGHAEKRN